MSKALRAAFQRSVHRRRPRPVGSRLTTVGYRHFEGGLLGREVSTGADRAAEPGVERLDRVRRGDDGADLGVEVEERHELRPRACPQLHDRRVASLPALRELGQAVVCGRFGRRRCRSGRRSLASAAQSRREA
jgi:hypothetical protein